MKNLIMMICALLIAAYAGAQTKTVLQSSDLNKGITEHIAKTYAGSKIIQTNKVVTDKVVTYEVIVEKEGTKTTLFYDDKGGFVKADAAKAATLKPATTTEPANTAKPATMTRPATTTKPVEQQKVSPDGTVKPVDNSATPPKN